MKNKFSLSLLMAAWMLILAGCEDYSGKGYELQFENASRFAIQIIPLTTEWTGFSLVPGQIVKLVDIQNVDYIFKPTDKVQEGSASTERSVVFVDAPPAFPAATTP